MTGAAPKTRMPVVAVEWDKLQQLPKRTPWAERASQINRTFPALKGFDFTRAFREDRQLFAEVFGAMLALEGERTHTWGPRPLPSVADGASRIKQFLGEDYSLDPFPEAFAFLTRGMSQRQIARKTGINRSSIERICNGSIEPDIYTMEKIARAFKKQPGFWLEYRLCAIFNALYERMVGYAHESSISIYRKVLAQETG